MTLAMKRPALLELTSMRFFAAMAVFLGHFNEYLRLPGWFAGVFVGGYGVSFFFVLSGFILCYRYWDDFAGGVDAKGYRPYMVARIARVYPSYAMALVLLTVLYLSLSVLKPGSVLYPPNAFTSWLANLFALQTFAPSYATQQYWNAPGWSISTEISFYLMCPFILAIIARRCRSLGSLLLAFALVLSACALLHAAILHLVLNRGWNRDLWLELVATRNIFWRLPEFVTGVVAARLLYGGHLGILQGAGARNALLVAGLAGVVFLNLLPMPTDVPSILVSRQVRLYFVYMIPFAAIVLALAAGATFLSGALRRPSFTFLGEISYAVYIYHWIAWVVVAVLTPMLGQNRVYFAWGMVAVILAGSAASYLLFERPARQWIRARFGGLPAGSTQAGAGPPGR